jgi:cyclophilin family peptidyl-prolyl cis-trans isomerase
MRGQLPLLLLLACGGRDPDSDSDVADTGPAGPPEVVVTTTQGAFTVQLDPEAAPVTVENFLAYVDAGFYDGDDTLGATVFHRVVADFVVQGGGFVESGGQKSTRPPIVLEAGNGLSNLRGTLAMARTNVPDSATSQFYVNLVDNTFLDQSGSNPGYAVFGRVTAGLDVIDTIGAAPVAGERPVTAIVITDCERAE